MVCGAPRDYAHQVSAGKSIQEEETWQPHHNQCCGPTRNQYGLSAKISVYSLLARHMNRTSEKGGKYTGCDDGGSITEVGSGRSSIRRGRRGSAAIARGGRRGGGRGGARGARSSRCRRGRGRRVAAAGHEVVGVKGAAVVLDVCGAGVLARLVPSIRSIAVLEGLVADKLGRAKEDEVSLALGLGAKLIKPVGSLTV